MTCTGRDRVLKTSDDFDFAAYERVVESVNELYDDLASSSLQSGFAGCIVRLAGHDFMDFRYQLDPNNTKRTTGSTGGSDGCINFNDPDNRGLAKCISETKLQTAYDEHCD